MTYAVGSTGLSLQHNCRRVHMLEAPYNEGIMSQALGRVRRLNNPFPVVFVYEYFVQNTIDDQIVARNLRKAIPQAMAGMNSAIFTDNDESVGTVDVGE